MPDLKIGSTYTITDVKHPHHGRSVTICGKECGGKYPVRESNGSGYLLEPQQIGATAQKPELESPDLRIKYRNTGKVLPKFR